MKISQLSKAIGVPVPTLRRWTVEFAAGLSPEARGIDGRARVFSARDMRLLRRVKELLAEDEATYASVRRQLAAEKLHPPEEASGYADAPANGGASPEQASDEERVAAERFVRAVAEPLIAQAVLQVRQQCEAQILALQTEVAELRDVLDRLEREARRDETPSERRRWLFG